MITAHDANRQADRLSAFDPLADVFVYFMRPRCRYPNRVHRLGGVRNDVRLESPSIPALRK